MTVDELLTPRGDASAPTKLEFAKLWLWAQLADGPDPQREIEARAKAAGIAWATVRRAKEKLDIVPDPSAVKSGLLRDEGHAPEAVAHFINRLVFCMFAESAGLLPERMFRRMLEQARRHPGDFPFHGSNLFRAMKEGGWIGYDEIDWFNGGLFDDDTAIPLTPDDLALVRRAADRNWSEIDTSIFGTLFERGLDPGKEAQIGAHYTDRDKINQIVDPVILRPLLAEWEEIKKTISALHQTHRANRRARSQPTLAEATYRAFLNRLRKFRVLDPACGSGNFLYVSLLTLKDIEHRVMIEAEAFGFGREDSLHPIGWV